MKPDQSFEENEHFPWFDPMGASGKFRPLLWFLLFLLVISLQGSHFIFSLPGNLNSGSDFFQDWASAKDWLDGRPLYGPLSDSLNRFLDIQADNKNITMDVHVNAHPLSLFLSHYPLHFSPMSTPCFYGIWSCLVFLFALPCSFLNQWTYPGIGGVYSLLAHFFFYVAPCKAKSIKGNGTSCFSHYSLQPISSI